MPILPNPTAAEVPEIHLINWAVIETERNETHFVGYSVALGHARVSSPIVDFDESTRSGSTHTARKYVLKGVPGLCADGRYILGQWLAGYKVPEWRDITATFVLPPNGSGLAQ